MTLRHGMKAIVRTAATLDVEANKFFKTMQERYPDFEVINVQIVQLNTCVRMYITFVY